MAKNIEINVKTNDGYEVLYPKINSNNTEISNDVLEKFGIENGNLNDVLEKLSGSVIVEPGQLKVSDIGENWTNLSNSLSLGTWYGKSRIAIGKYIWYITDSSGNTSVIQGWDTETMATKKSSYSFGIGLVGIFKINETTFGVFGTSSIFITSDFMNTWTKYDCKTTSGTSCTFTSYTSMCVYKNRLYICGAGSDKNTFYISEENDYSNLISFSNTYKGPYGQIACSDNVLAYTNRTGSDSRYQYLFYTTADDVTSPNLTSLWNKDLKVNTLSLIYLNNKFWNFGSGSPAIKCYSYNESTSKLDVTVLNYDYSSYGASDIVFDGTYYYISFYSNLDEDSTGSNGIIRVNEDFTNQTVLKDNTYESGFIGLCYCNNVLVAFPFTMKSYNNIYSKSKININNYLMNFLKEKITVSGELVFEYGNFIGTGTHTEYVYSTLTFNKRPTWVIFPGYYIQIFSGMVDSGKGSPAEDGGNQYCNYIWSGNTLEWYTNDGKSNDLSMDTAGKKYWYFALY